jgi:Bacteriophage Lambda NinG protein.
MYNIPYNDTEANLFFDEYKDYILEKIKEKRGCFTETIDSKTYIFCENAFIKDFLDKYSNETELRKLITGRPDELLEIVKTVQKECRDETDHFKYVICDSTKELTEEEMKICKIKISNKKKKTQRERNNEQGIIQNRDAVIALKGIPDFRRMIYRIFVDNIYGKQDFFNKSDFIRKKGLRVCPYCGRSYIFSVTRRGRKIDVKPQIDHFIPKGEFPFLAFSYYNLIPSCDSCNVVCKKEQKPLSKKNQSYRVFNPYMYIDEPFFQFKLHNLNIFSDFLTSKEQNIQVDFNPKFKNKIGLYEKLFGLKSLYKEHNDLAHDLLIRKQYWTSDTNQQYYKNILNCDPNIREKMILAFLGYYESTEGHGKRPFSKFLSDILAHYDKLVQKGKP